MMMKRDPCLSSVALDEKASVCSSLPHTTKLVDENAEWVRHCSCLKQRFQQLTSLLLHLELEYAHN